MSVEFYVACVAPLPARDDDWSFNLGPVSVNRVARGEGDMFALVRDLVPAVIDIVVFSSRAAGSALGEGLARIAAEMIGGAALCENGPELIASYDAPKTAPSAKEIQTRFETWIRDEKKREEEIQARAVAEWQQKLESDPTLKHDSDWSNLI